jgi:TP901 family phage tail tape measure protein
MSKPLIIPSIFTAEDKMSPSLRSMGRGLDGFTQKAEALGARSERAFRKLTPGLSSATKEMLSMASTAAVVGGAFMLGKSSIDSIMNYEEAVQSFRTIVSDLNDADFSKFEKAIGSVAKSTGKSTVDVATSFEKIAGLNSKFADTAKGLSQVSAAAITLSKASKDELGVSAENLVGIMNQFSYSADKADKTINILAAGQAVGASSITQTAEAFVTFGSVAAGANVTLEESVGLVQTLGKFSIFGAEAGTQLKGSLVHLQKSGMGYASGQFKINDALEEAKVKFDKLKTAKEKDAYVTDTFGLINLGVGRILLNNTDLIKEYTKGVTGTKEAQLAAGINSNTLSNRLSELSNAWTNMLTSSNAASSGLERAKSAISYVTDNLDTIVAVGINVIKFFAIWKASIIATSLVTGGLNIALGIQGALTGIVSVAVGKSALALKAYEWSTKAVTAAQWLWNAAMTANPIGLVIAAVAGLVAGLAYLASQYQGWGDQWDIMMTGMGYSIDAFVYQAKSMWGVMSNAFATTVDGMKIIWYGFQNATGGMSDVAYANEKKKMAQGAKDRQNYIKENQSLANLSAMNAALYTNNVLTRKGSTADVGGSEAAQSANRQQKIKDLESSWAMKMVTSQPGVKDAMNFQSTKVAQAENTTTTNNANANATITVKNDGNVPVDFNSGGTKSVSVMPQMTSTMSTKK